MILRQGLIKILKENTFKKNLKQKIIQVLLLVRHLQL